MHTAGVTVGINATFPWVVSIVRAQETPTALGSVDFVVTFSESVTGCDASDFLPATTGISGSGVTAVVGSDASYTVTVDHLIASDDATTGANHLAADYVWTFTTEERLTGLALGEPCGAIGGPAELAALATLAALAGLRKRTR